MLVGSGGQGDGTEMMRKDKLTIFKNSDWRQKEDDKE